MIRKRAFGAAAFALVLAPALGAQQPTDPMQDMAARIQSMQQMMQEMHHMMMSMHGGGMQGMQMTPDGHDAPAPPPMSGMGMPGMQGQPGQGMAMGGMGTQNMQGAAGTACGARGPDAGLGALFMRPVADLALTEAQRTALQEVLARAQAEAREELTAEQRARLEITTPGGAGMCPSAPAAAPTQH